MYWIVGGLILFALIIMLYFQRINIKCDITYNSEDHLNIDITLSLLSMRIYKRCIQINLEHGEKLQEMLVKQIDKQNAKNYIREFLQLNHFISTLLKNINIFKFTWKSTIGTGEASSTGLICGGIWTIKGYIIGLISSHRRLFCTPEIFVIPNFKVKRVESDIDCMGSIRIGQAINVFLQILKNMK